MIRIGRRRSRSTQTPAGRLSRMNGRNSIVVEQAELERRHLRTVAAISGRASWRDRGPERPKRSPRSTASGSRGGGAGSVSARSSTAECTSAGRHHRSSPRPTRASSIAACWSKASPTSPRAAGPRSWTASPRRSTSVARRVPARPDVRREPQPLGVHRGRRARGGVAGARGDGRPARSTRSTWRSTRASTRGSGPWTSCRSCRSPTRRWTTASRWPAPSGARIAARWDLPVYLYAEAAARRIA